MLKAIISYYLEIKNDALIGIYSFFWKCGRKKRVFTRQNLKQKPKIQFI